MISVHECHGMVDTPLQMRSDGLDIVEALDPLGNIGVPCS